MGVLRAVVTRGGALVEGNICALGDKLSLHEIDTILGWVQSHRSNRIYALWHERDSAVHDGMQATR